MQITFIDLVLIRAGSDIFRDNMKWELTHTDIYPQAKCKIRIYSRLVNGILFPKMPFCRETNNCVPSCCVCVTAWYHLHVCLHTHTHTAYMLLSREVASLHLSL